MGKYKYRALFRSFSSTKLLLTFTKMLPTPDQLPALVVACDSSGEPDVKKMSGVTARLIANGCSVCREKLGSHQTCACHVCKTAICHPCLLKSPSRCPKCRQSYHWLMLEFLVAFVLAAQVFLNKRAQSNPTPVALSPIPAMLLATFETNKSPEQTVMLAGSLKRFVHRQTTAEKRWNDRNRGSSKLFFGVTKPAKFTARRPPVLSGIVCKYQYDARVDELKVEFISRDQLPGLVSTGVMRQHTEGESGRPHST